MALRKGMTERRILPMYAVIYVSRGENYFESEATGRLTIRAGQTYMLFPGLWHKYGACDTEWEHYWFVFEGTIPDMYRTNGMLAPSAPVYDTPGLSAYLPQWDGYIRLAADKQAGYLEHIAVGIADVLASVLLTGQSQTPKGNADVAAVVSAMQKNIAAMEFDLASFCADRSIAFEYIRKRFRKETGKSPGSYFKMLKVHAAKKRLVESDEPVSVIAGSLGYDDPYYFSRWFKKHEKVSPAHYRSGLRSWE